MLARPQLHRRGFALLVVMVLAAAMAVLAIGISATAAHTEAAAAYSEGNEVARMIAESGLARATLWAQEVINASADNDYDGVLDPDGTATCTFPFDVSTSGNAGATTFLPKFTDGSRVEYPSGSGRNWYQVNLTKGAYLVRYEDNADDARDGTNWTARTSNTGGCDEGADSGRADNPARDRDGAIWVHVIGIYPGTDVNSAAQRVMLRKLLRAPAGSGGAVAMFVGGQINDDIEGDNDFGAVEIGGDFDNSAPFCGSVRTANSDNLATANPSCSGVNPLNQSVGPVTTVTIPAPESSTWFDWSTPCNFYENDVGFFYWDAARGTCASGPGATIVAPDPDPSTPGGCWTPILLAANGVGTEPANQFVLAYEPFETAANDEVRLFTVVSGCAAWKPNGNHPAATYPDPGTGHGGGAAHSPGSAGGPPPHSTFKSYYSAPVTVNLPDWDTACSITSPLTPAPGYSCSTCDATNPTVMMCKAGTVAGPETMQFLGPADGADIAAYVPGAYYNDGDFEANRSFGGTFPAVPGPPTASDLPMISLVVKGQFRIKGGVSFQIGVGSAATSIPGALPSLVANSTDEPNAAGTQMAFGGTIFVRGDFRGDQLIHAFGPVFVTGSLHPHSGTFRWSYKQDWLGGGASIAAPEPILTFPMGF